MTKSHVEHVVPIIAGTLKAILDKQPGPNRHHHFFVTAEVEAEIDWKIKLVAAEPQGINPLEEILRFDVVVPPGIHSDAIARRTVRYEESPPGADYRDVLLHDGKETARARVEIVV